MQFDFQIPLAPVAKGRPRFNRNGRTYTPKKTKAAELATKRFIIASWGNKPPLEGALELHAFFYLERPASVSVIKRPYPSVKPDIDNYLKLLLDAANKILWDDGQVVSLGKTVKLYDPSPRTYFSVRQMK